MKALVVGVFNKIRDMFGLIEEKKLSLSEDVEN